MSKQARGGAGDVAGFLIAAVLVMWCTAAMAQQRGPDDEPSVASDTGSNTTRDSEPEDEDVYGLSAGRSIDGATQVLAVLGAVVFIHGAVPAVALIAEGASFLGLIILFIYAIPGVIMIVGGLLH